MGRSKLQKISQRLRFGYKEHRSQPLFLKKDARIENWQVFSRPGPMPSTHKKVVVRKIDRDSINGYVAPANYIREGRLELLNTAGNVVAIDLRDIKGVYFAQINCHHIPRRIQKLQSALADVIGEGRLELLNTAGNVVAIDLRDIKGVYFVREFGDSESLTRKTFTSRPRTEGLWVRLKFKDNEVLEGMMPNDLSLTIGEGFLINPADLRSNTQRIFVPRLALESLTVLAVIGATRRRRRGMPSDTRQVQLFGESS